MIVLIVSLAGYTARGPTFNGSVDGATIVTRSATPFCDAARTLLGDGVDPATPLVMRHAGSDHDALASRIGTAAGLAVREGERAPAFELWRASPRAAETPPMRFGAGQPFGTTGQKGAFTASPANEIDGGQR